jgi:hypothetical protein
MNTAHPAAGLVWLVVEFVNDDCRFTPIGAYATREEAEAAMAQRVGCLSLYRPAPSAVAGDRS